VEKNCLNIDIIIKIFMIVSEFFEQSLILWPIAASFVWLKVGATYCIQIFNYNPLQPLLAKKSKLTLSLN